jgi:hypothetical protein
MSKNCEFVYFDKNGNRSKAYYDVAAVHGHDVALASYIHDTLDGSMARQSKPIMDLIAANDALAKSKTFSAGKYIAATTLIRQFKSVVPEEVKLAVAKKQYTLDLFHKIKDNSNKAKFTYENAKETADAFFADPVNASVVKAYLVENETKNSSSAKQGSLIHGVLSEAFILRSKYLSEKSVDDPFRTSRSFINEAVTNWSDNELDISEIDSNVVSHLEQIMDDLVKEISAKMGTEDFIILPEINLLGKSVKFENSMLRGIADIVVFSPQLNKAMVIDIKTKTESSILNFDSLHGEKMTGVFEGFRDNPETHANIQTSIYATILKNDYGINDVSTHTYKVVGNFTANDAAPGARTWRFSSIIPKLSGMVDGELFYGKITSLITDPDPANSKKYGIDAVLDEMYKGNLTSIRDNTQQAVANEMVSVKKTQSGQFSWHDKFNGITLYKATEKEMKDAITKVFKDLSAKRVNASKDLIKLFNQGEAGKDSIWNDPFYALKASHILHGISKATHDIFDRDNLPLAGIGPDVIVIQNKSTKEISLLSLSPSWNAEFQYHEEGSDFSNTTMLGPWINDTAVIKTHGDNLIPEADLHNLNLLRLALVAAELKRNVPSMGKVRTLQSVMLLSPYDSVRTSDMGAQLGLMGLIKKTMESNNAEVPFPLQTTLADKQLSAPEEYQDDVFLNFARLIQEHKDPLRGLSTARKSRNIEKHLRERIKELTDSGLSLYGDYELEKAMMRYVKQVALSVSSKGKASDNPKFVEALNAYLAYRNMLVLERPAFNQKFIASVNSAKTASDPYADAVDSMINLHQQRVRDEISEFMATHKQLVEDLIGESKVSSADRIFSIDVYKEVFTPMMADEYRFDENNTSNWMKFKDPSDTSLSAPQKAYIEFFNKMIKQSSKGLPETVRAAMFNPDDSLSMLPDEIKPWRVGYLPIFPASATTDLQETARLENSDKLMEVIAKSMRSLMKKTEKSKLDNLPWHYESGFMDQVEPGPGRGSASTRKLLKITDKGEVVPGDRNIEMNPIILLNLYVLNAVKKEHMEQAAFAAYALDSSLEVAKQVYKDVDVEPLRKLLSDIQKIRIHEQYEDSGKFGQAVDVINRSASVGLFWLSLKQTIVETATASTQITSSVLGHAFNRLLFKGETKYDTKDIAWAAYQIERPFGHQLMIDYGLYNSDLGQYTSSEYIPTRSMSAAQMKHGFAPIRHALKQATQTVILAQMNKEGVTEECYTLNEKTGRYYYDETKDTRFYVYDETNPVKGQKATPPTTAEEKGKHIFWKAHRSEMMKENSIKDNRMIRPFTVKHLQAMKSYSVRLFGAMDNSEVQAAEVHALGRSLLKFKKWMRQKIDNYGATTHMSYKEGIWSPIKNEAGEIVDYDFIQQEFEGHVQSLIGIVKDIRRLGWSETINTISPRRAENLTKLLADLLMWLVLFLSAMLLMQTEFYDKVIGKEIIKGLSNAVGDIMPVQGAASMLTGSPMAAAGVTSNAVGGVLKSTFYFMTGDWDNAIYNGDKALESLGGYRFGEGLIEFGQQL